MLIETWAVNGNLEAAEFRWNYISHRVQPFSFFSRKIYGSSNRNVRQLSNNDFCVDFPFNSIELQYNCYNFNFLIAFDVELFDVIAISKTFHNETVDEHLCYCWNISKCQMRAFPRIRLRHFHTEKRQNQMCRG